MDPEVLIGVDLYDLHMQSYVQRHVVDQYPKVVERVIEHMTRALRRQADAELRPIAVALRKVPPIQHEQVLQRAAWTDTGGRSIRIAVAPRLSLLDRDPAAEPPKVVFVEFSARACEWIRRWPAAVEADVRRLVYDGWRP